ncbi:hypothetical protein COV82_03585 [Candidatus Peregrinibacteria bacterium CG11_big_fil_rev_8_21_14_0_20_46_8]|nr:MAG: hypothetical protein COV82_03585 [Candidatus Peregrinibacteria bacterium CG11_big_fil_rev_8_21_14_0_20_46_8]
MFSNKGLREGAAYLDSAVEAIRNGEYYPIGLMPRQIDLIDPFTRTTDVVALLRTLRARQHGFTHAVVANPFANIRFELRRNEKEQSSDADYLIEREAMSRARLLAEYDRILYESIQDVLDADPHEAGRRVPVLVMSDLVDDNLFRATVDRVWDLCRSDEFFAEKIYSCVPESMRPKKHKKMNLAELKALPGQSFHNAWGRMDYVVHQIAYVALIGGKKLGHAREQDYDQITFEVAQRLGFRQYDLSFEEMPVAEARREVPYAAVTMQSAAIQNDALGVMRSLQPLHPPEGQFDYDMARAQMDYLRSEIEFSSQVYVQMLRRCNELQIDDNLKGQLLEAIIFRAVREAVFSLSNSPYPWWRFIFHESGLLKFLKRRMTIEEFENSAPLLPFRCERLRDESAESFMARFVNGLIHNNGPEIAGLPERGTRKTLCNLIYDFVNAAAGEHAEAAKWLLDYRGAFHWRLLHKEVPCVPGYSADQFQEERFKNLQEFLNAIRGTRFENIYRQLVEMPEIPELEEAAGDEAAVRQLLQSPFLGDEVKKYFAERMS